jgi:hypothetical protein
MCLAQMKPKVIAGPRIAPGSVIIAAAILSDAPRPIQQVPGLERKRCSEGLCSESLLLERLVNNILLAL